MANTGANLDARQCSHGEDHDKLTTLLAEFAAFKTTAEDKFGVLNHLRAERQEDRNVFVLKTTNDATHRGLEVRLGSLERWQQWLTGGMALLSLLVGGGVVALLVEHTFK